MPRKSEPRKQTVIRYELPDGTRAKKGDPGAKKRRCRTRTYYAKLSGDRKPTSLGTEDLGEAWVRLRRLLREREDQAAGIFDHTRTHAATSLEDHIQAWAAVLRDKGTMAESITLKRQRLAKLAAEAGWVKLADITADSCLRALASLRDRLGLSAQTRNHYLDHAQQLCRWAVGPGKRMRDNPLVGLGKLNVEEDERHPRRCPTSEEIRTLLTWLATGRPPAHTRQHTSRPTDGTAPVRRWMSGPQRALAYKLAMATGFRAKEIRSLRRASFDLDKGEVTVVAGYSKHRRKDTQPLPEWLIPELREWFDADGGLWHYFRHEGGEVLQWDLEGVGIPYLTDEGYLDWHSMRIWYITELADNPANTIKTLMELARHSTPTLTMRVYARAKRHNLKAAVDELPNPMADPSAQKKAE